MDAMRVSTDRILTTKRTLMSYPSPDDSSSIYLVITSPLFPDQLPLKEMGSENEVLGWINNLQDHWSSGKSYAWMIRDRKAKNLLGQVTISKFPGKNVWALAFWVHPAHWGQGYATECAERVVAFCFEELGAEKIWAGAGIWNIGSNRVLEKLGMQYIRNNPEGYYSRGKPIETREYEISYTQWLECLQQED